MWKVIAQSNPEDLGAFVFHYLPSLGIALFLSLILELLIKSSQFVRDRRSNWIYVLTPLMLWLLYFALTARWTLALEALESESEQVAELSYKTIFKPDLRQSVKLIDDQRVEANVRFYAACRVADLLRTKDTMTQAKIFKDVENAPSIETEFFGTNDLNYKLFVPDHNQVHMSAQQIIEQRLEDLAHAD